MSKLGSLINNSWVAGVGTGLLVFALTSGLVAKLDRNTLALAVLCAALAGLAARAWSLNHKLKADLAYASGKAVFDPATGFFYWPTDAGHDRPLCPVCAGQDAIVPVQRGDYGWHCTSGDCKFHKGYEE